VTDLLGFGPARDQRYGIVINYLAAPARRRLLELAAAGGIHAVKVKVGRGDEDLKAFRDCFSVLGPDARVGIDANEAWGPGDAVAACRRFEELGADFVEQPVAPGDEATLAAVTKALAIPVVLDESVCSPADARRAVQLGLGSGFNVRVGKVGGLRAAATIARLAADADFAVNCGSLVGETGILAAAGRHFACTHECHFVEGSYGELLLERDVTEPSVMFGEGGAGPPISGPGLGVEVREDVLDKYSTLKWIR
jgi:muconate cycloisomerase